MSEYSDVTGGSWQCGICGAWIPPNEPHTCPTISSFSDIERFVAGSVNVYPTYTIEQKLDEILRILDNISDDIKAWKER